MPPRKRPGDGGGKPPPSTLPHAEQRELAREAALRLLAVRERSAAEIRERLRRRGFEPDVIEGVIERLQETGLQDDQRFAERFAEEAAHGRGYGSRRVRLALLQRGIDRSLAAAAATESPESEEERARALARSKAARMAGLPPDVRLRRVLGLLARRGFDAEVCSRIAREVAGDRTGASGDEAGPLD